MDMNWLIVVDQGCDLKALAEILAKYGAHLVQGADCVPLEPDDLSCQVVGPENLADRLKGEAPIKGVYPSSDYSLY